MTDDNSNKPAQNTKPRTTKRPPEYDLFTIKNVNGEDDWKKRCGIWAHQNGYLTGRFGETKIVLKPRTPKQPAENIQGHNQPPPQTVHDAPELLQ